MRAGGVDVRVVPWPPSPVRAAVGVARTRSLSAARFWDARLHAEVVKASKGADLLVVEYAQLSPYVRGTCARRTVLDLHNIESALTQSYAATRRGVRALPYALESRALAALERRALQRFDAVAVVSDVDRHQLPGPVRGEVLLCPNGWDPGAPLPASAEPVVVFVGLLGWKPNVDAALWLVQQVWPLVRQSRPDARLLLVGRDPAPEVRALAAPDIDVTGTVPDIAPFLARAQVAVAPLRAGGGSRLKVLEALDAGRPVVATTVGAEGLEDLVGEGVELADDPATFAGVVLDLLASPERAQEMGRRGAAAVRARHDWDATLARLVAFAEQAGASQRRSSTER